ncbi:MAG: restriction endonuclease [Anaerolineae bacterium]|nr:restriction endonuclease [Anaerolineae bacterium]
MLGAAFSLLFMLWPLLLLGLLDQRRGRLTAALGAWTIVAGIRVAMLFLPSVLPLAITIPEPWNTVLFVVTGAVLWGLWVWRRQRTQSRMRGLGSTEELFALTPEQFEEMVAQLYRLGGHRARRVGGQSDHGVDVIVEASNGEKWVVQCKRQRRPIGEPTVRELPGIMAHEGAQAAALVTAGTFSEPARRWAQGKPIYLYDGAAFVALWRRAHQERTTRNREREPGP